MMNNINAVLTIAYRDVLKFARDRTRFITAFIFPLIFIGVLGGSLEANLSEVAGYSFIAFAFTGVVAQTLFQATASGVISLNQDREQSLSQEFFVSPISRYAIVIGKIIGESLVAFVQGTAIVLFGLIIRVPLTAAQLLLLVPIAIPICLLGGAFGVLVLSRLKSQTSAFQIFPFIMFPQFFLGGVFSPIKELPAYLLIPSRVVPLTYAVDLVRGMFYAGKPEYAKIVLHHPAVDLAVLAGFFTVFFVLGTYSFVQNERNR